MLNVYAAIITQQVNVTESRISMEEKLRRLFLMEFFIEIRIKYLQNQFTMVYNLKYRRANFVLYNALVLLPISYEADFYREERRVAA